MVCGSKPELYRYFLFGLENNHRVHWVVFLKGLNTGSSPLDAGTPEARDHRVPEAPRDPRGARAGTWVEGLLFWCLFCFGLSQRHFSLFLGFLSKSKFFSRLFIIWKNMLGYIVHLVQECIHLVCGGHGFERLCWGVSSWFWVVLVFIFRVHIVEWQIKRAETLWGCAVEVLSKNKQCDT